MKVAVTDFSFPDLTTEEGVLRPIGGEIFAGQCKTADKLIPLVRHADAVITQFAPLTAEVIEAMNSARVIVRYGIGVDNVDLERARQRGIPVCNVPDYCIDEVADQTLAFLLALTRQVPQHTAFLKKGNWGLASRLDEMRTLRDLTVGLVGFGRIGREVAARVLAFKAAVVVFDPAVPAEEIGQMGCRAVSLDELFSTADVVSLHCPSNPKTRGMINAQSLAKMKHGALFINVARGDLVDSAALVEALESGRLSGAALDVFSPEPIPANHPILAMQNVVLAPHIASASVKAVAKLRTTAAQIAAAALRGDPLPNVVNGVCNQLTSSRG